MGGAKRLPGWGVVRLVGICAVGVGPRLAGTKPHGKLATAVGREKSAGTTEHQPEGFLEEKSKLNWATRM